MKRGRQSKELIGLVVLFAIFLAFALYAEQTSQELTKKEVPSSFNASVQGVKALYLLLDHQGYKVERLKTSLDSLGPQDGLVTMIEQTGTKPFQRPISEEELKALRHWVEQGGTALYFVASGPRPLDPKDSVFGEIAILTGKEASKPVPPASDPSPYTQDVAQIALASTLRIQPGEKANYETLFEDEQGALVVHKPLGKGHLIAVVGTALTNNAEIKLADNVLFLANIAHVSVGATRRTAQFDEYHHGVGFAKEAKTTEGGILANTPLPLRLAFFHIVALGLLLVYNGNLRFGQPFVVPMVTSRPSTDYVGSMARLHQRSGAADITLETLYRQFQRDLMRPLDLPPETPLSQQLKRAEKKFGLNGETLKQLFVRCEEVCQGQRISEAEMVNLVKQIDNFRRSLNLVGN